MHSSLWAKWLQGSCLVAALTGLALSSLGQGAQNIIKQRAKNIRDQNNASQGVPATSPAPPTRTAVPVQTYAATPKGPSAQEKHLEANLAAVQAGSATEAQRQAIANSLLNLAPTPKPSEAAITRLAAELAAGLAEKPLSAQRRTRLASALNQVLNGRRTSPLQMQEHLSEVQLLFQAEGLPKPKANVIGEALKAVANETQPSQ